MAFARTQMIEALPPPAAEPGPFERARASLFGSWPNALLTFLCAYMLWLVVPPVVRFLLIDAVWSGSSREDCITRQAGQSVGACWPFIQAKFSQLIYGFYPAAERWRVNLTFVVGGGLLITLLIPRVPHKILNAVLFFLIYPLVAYLLLVGGVFHLTYVPTQSWGGLLVTLVVAVTGIVASLPLGVLLALGRRSSLPLVRGLSVAFIEFWRGIPLITVLFFATYMLPLFLKSTWTVDALARVLIGIAVFSAAYIAEVVRGGLQAVPRGQFEAAEALGMGYWRTMTLIVLPQALRLVIPGIVNTFIGLFKDTTLVLIVAIFDLLGQLRASFSDPAWTTPVTVFTGFAFAGLIYFAFCFGMSRYSLAMERRLRMDR